MPAFFFLSGLFFGKSETLPFVSFLIKKTRLILWPYLLWSVIQGSLEIGMQHYINGSRNWSDLLYLMTTPIDQFWFLHALFFIQIALYLFGRLSTSRLLIVGLGFSALAAFADIPVFDKSMTYFIYVSLGLIVSRHHWTDRLPKLSLSSVVGQIAALTLFLCGCTTLATSAGWFVPILPALAGTTATVIAARQLAPHLVFSWLVTLGRLSLPIYLMHTLAAAGIRIALSHLFHVQNIAVHEIAGVAMGLLIPILAMMLFRKATIDKLLGLH